MDNLPQTDERPGVAKIQDATDWRYPTRLTGARSQQVESSTVRSPIHQRLFDYFWARLPFARIVEETGARNHDQLAHATSASHAKLEGWRQDIQRFAETVCDCSIEHRSVGNEIPSVTQRAVQSRRETLVSRLPSLRPLPPLLTASLMAKPLDDVCATIDGALRQYCHSLIDDLFRMLEALVDAKISGIVERTGSNCTLYFYRHVMIQETVGTTARTESHITGSKIIEDRYVTRNSRIEYRLGYHEHHVMNVVDNTIEDSQVDVPQQYLPLVETVPGWLRPHLCLVEGDLIRELIVEKELETDFLETTVVTRTERAYSPTITFDPAIVFGDYVLAGWGSREIRHEAALQEAERLKSRNRASRRDSVGYGVASAVLLLTGTVLLLSSRVSPSLLLTPAILTTLLGFVVAYFSMHQHTQARQQVGMYSWFPLAATTAVASLVLTIQFAIAGFLYSFWLLLVGLMMFVVFVAAFRLASNRHPGT